MPDTPYYLLIDQGGHASRALVCDARGRLLSQGRHALAPAIRGAVWEYDAQALLTGVHHAVAQALTGLDKNSRGRIQAAALATQRANTACWDRWNLTPLAPVIAWQDRRAADFMASLDAETRHLIQDLTGLPPSPHYGASKLRWCLEHLAPVHEAQAAGCLAMGPMAAFLAQALTRNREALADPVNASRTLLWDLHRRDWAPSLLALFGIPAGALPRCVPARHDFGILQCGEWNLPLRLVTGDQAAALFARGRPDPRAVYVTLGTGAFILRPTGATPVTCPGLLTSIVHQDGENALYALEGTVNGAGNALRWYEAETGHAIDYDGLNALLAADDDAPLFLNGIGGLGTPFMQADFPSRFTGAGNDEQRLTAVVDSILFLLQLNLEHMAAAGLPAPTHIEIGGGLARLDHLCRRLADLSELPVLRGKDHETTARGLWHLLARDHGPAPATGDDFEPCNRPRLQRRYGEWKALLYDAVDRCRK